MKYGKVRKFIKYKKPKSKIAWQEAPDIKIRIKYLMDRLSIEWIRLENVHCFRSENSSSNAIARIWGFPRVWQQALNQPPAYVLEVISERFDKLSEKQRDKVLLHELAHIPKNFSGATVPHTRKMKGSFHDKLGRLIAAYERSSR